ncbi:MAG: hypothetical protein KDK36_18845, partial [Leptospiraceae bacterium]|nr:hypothetical protein [Leptospiraceae bacterium]
MSKKYFLESELERVDSYKLEKEERRFLLKNGRAEKYKLPNKGYRVYFICRACQERKRFLYKVKEHRFCRSCLKLTYESSQKKNKFYRTWKLVSGRKEDFKFFRPCKKPEYKKFIVSMIVKEKSMDIER